MRFSNDFNEVDKLLRATYEMLRILTNEDGFSLGYIHDMTVQLQSVKIPGTHIAANDLVKMRSSLDSINSIVNFFTRMRSGDGIPTYPNLDVIVRDLMPFPQLTAAIGRVIDRFGNIKDSASAELTKIRSSLASMSGTINSSMRRIISRAVKDGYIDTDTAPSIRDGRLVIPVSPMYKRKINGIVHDESASGKTIFIEPAEVVEANNRLRELQIEERREILRILVELADVIRPHLDDLFSSYDVLGTLDFINAKACFAQETGGCLPHLSSDPEMEWYHACHPILKTALGRQGKKIVPLDITLGDDSRILIISGPNAGGKSVTLKTVAIVQYMTQCGILPPVYENSHIGIIDNIFIDIGDDQSIEDDLSTYSSHLRNMKYFLSHGNGRTLILIDEFGSGTEPQIGGAIAQAILKQFNSRKMWGVITTHFQNLKRFANETPGLVNGSMLYDRHLMRPEFKLSIGTPGSSFAIEIARKTGFPNEVINEAEEIAGSDYVNLDRYLLEITRDKRYWENKRSSIHQKEKKLEHLLAQYEEDARQLKEKRREIIQTAHDEAKRLLDESNAAIERTIHEIRMAQAEKEKTLEARKSLAKRKQDLTSGDYGKEHPLLEKAPKRKKLPDKETDARNEKGQIAVGDNVQLDGKGIVGKVLEITGNSAVVVFGQLKTTTKTDRLTRTLKQISSGNAKQASFISLSTSDALRERQLNFKQEIDVRGMRVDEAIQAITYFIDDAIQFNAHQVRILHGTGTGALRQYTRNYLGSVSGVRSYHDEDVRFGGAGITVVELD